MNTNGQLLASIVTQVVPQLRDISDSAASDKPDPKKWSRKEILGHLIDSAVNNHRRFVLANFQDDLIFAGYEQESWVAFQDYQHDAWTWIVDFWQNYNFRLAAIIDRLPGETLTKQRSQHCLNTMAWKPIPKEEPATLDYFIKDYIGHLEHHVRQILPEYQPVIVGTYEFGN